jgi:hypothetical protein
MSALSPDVSACVYRGLVVLLGGGEPRGREERRCVELALAEERGAAGPSLRLVEAEITERSCVRAGGPVRAA